MTNSTTTHDQIQPNLWPALLAKLTIGNSNFSEELSKYLDTLPSNMRETISKEIMKYEKNVDLCSLPNQESGRDNPYRFLLHKAAEALQPQPPIDWIVKPMFSTGTVSLVVGDPGSKKTYSILDLAVCLATGKTWLTFETKPASVLLIDEESGVRRINRRLGNVMRGHFADGTIPLQYTSLARFNFRPNGSIIPEDLLALEEKIHETEAKFVVIDALADVMPGADENSVKDVQPIFMGLRQVADNTESAIVLIHHSNKAGDYRGSSAILGALDLLLMVKSKPDSPNIDFEVKKNRDDKPSNFSAVAHFEGEQFWLTSSEYAPKQKFNKAQNYVLKHLLNNGKSLVTDIQANADTCSVNSARKALYELVNSGLVRRVDGGKNGEKATYDLTEQGKEMGKTCL